jgi:hypothetical protein
LTAKLARRKSRAARRGVFDATTALNYCQRKTNPGRNRWGLPGS